MRRNILRTIAFVISASACSCPAGRLNIVTTTPDMADFARTIGGDRVTVVSLSRGVPDPHAVEPRPSMVMKVKKADLLIRVGMDLDLWVVGLMDASRNKDIMKGARGYCDVSEAVEKLEVPEGYIDGSMGDIHIYGNPHYSNSPANAMAVCGLILKKLCEMRTGDADCFTRNHRQFIDKLDAAVEKWKEELKPFAGAKIVTYHKSWPYFAEFFGLTITGFIEPKPGIPPTPSHVKALVEKMISGNVRTIIMEPWFNVKTAEAIAQKAGATVLVLPPTVDGVKGIDTYIDLLDYNIRLLTGSFRKAGGVND
jgi:zinc/manganese transport system substrate-binding protein